MYIGARVEKWKIWWQLRNSERMVSLKGEKRRAEVNPQPSILSSLEAYQGQQESSKQTWSRRWQTRRRQRRSGEMTLIYSSVLWSICKTQSDRNRLVTQSTVAVNSIQFSPMLYLWLVRSEFYLFQLGSHRTGLVVFVFSINGNQGIHVGIIAAILLPLTAFCHGICEHSDGGGKENTYTHPMVKKMKMILWSSFLLLWEQEKEKSPSFLDIVCLLSNVVSALMVSIQILTQLYSE